MGPNQDAPAHLQQVFGLGATLPLVFERLHLKNAARIGPEVATPTREV